MSSRARFLAVAAGLVLGLVLAEHRAFAFNYDAGKISQAGAVNPVASLPVGNPTILTMSAGVSQSSTPGVGLPVEFICTVDSYYKTGTGAQTATTSSWFLPANTYKRGGLDGLADSIAFITGGSGTCYVGPAGH